jgi:hypothetical protein
VSVLIRPPTDLLIRDSIKKFIDKQEQLARDAKSLMIYAGNSEVQVTQMEKGLFA